MRFFVGVICLVVFLFSGTKVAASTYFVTFKYKTSSEYSLKKPMEYLSDKSIQRRIRQHIEVDSSDLPVSRKYLSQVGTLVDSVLLSSKWFNGILVDVSEDKVNSLYLLDFVKDVKLVCDEMKRPVGVLKMCTSDEDAGQYMSSDNVYGDAFVQVSLLRGNRLHERGFKGKGLTVAVLDVGFPKYDNLSAFENLNTGRVVDTYDFTKRRLALTASETHGTKILSLLTGVLPGRYCGSATEANYALYITESAKYEQLIEEYFWCMAAERADSIGCDIISSSLGYSRFDLPYMDHLIGDLSKGVAPISIAASTAFSKGMFVVVSAGNEGDKDWHYITFPADSPDVMAVGAVSFNGMLGRFSSIGLPSMIKPEIVGMGVAATMIDVNGNIVQGNGTSYVVPQIAGFSACLWQAFPSLSAVDLKNVILATSSNHLSPDNLVGYGIPDFDKSFQILELKNGDCDLKVTVNPNPFTTSISVSVDVKISGLADYHLYSMQGKLVKSGVVCFSEGCARIDDLYSLTSGMMILKLIFGTSSVEVKVVKQT